MDKTDIIDLLAKHTPISKSVIDKEYLLKDISKAYEYVIAGQKTG